MSVSPSQSRDSTIVLRAAGRSLSLNPERTPISFLVSVHTQARANLRELIPAAALRAGEFDRDGDGKVSRDEVGTALPRFTRKEDVEGSTVEELVDGFMGMLDEDGDGYGDLEEFRAFMRKMSEMDGRLDLLPMPGTKRKARKRKRSAADHMDQHDEL